MGGSDRCHSPGGQRSPSARGLSETGRPGPFLQWMQKQKWSSRTETSRGSQTFPATNGERATGLSYSTRPHRSPTASLLPEGAARKHSGLCPSVPSHPGGGSAHPNSGLGRKGWRGGPGRPRLCPGKLLSRLLLPQACYRRPFRLGRVPADS